MKEIKYSIGIDFGTNSARCLIVNLEDGGELATFVSNYKRGRDGIIESRDANFARQDPLDYVECMEECVKNAVRTAKRHKKFRIENIVGIGVDTTGSTPIPVDEKGLPLSFSKEFRKNPNAMAWLWKDHTGYEEAGQITEMAHKNNPDYTTYCGGTYSSEWYFSKILRLARTDEKVYKASASFVEHCDLMPAMLVGDTNPKNLKRSRCAGGHKAMFNALWNGLPSQEFLSKVDSRLDGIMEKLYDRTYASDVKVGGLCREWAEKFGIPEGVAVSAGAFDAHMGAVGAGIREETLVKIMGTSTCDMMVAKPEKLNVCIKGVCGQVDGSIIPGYIGIEAGQSAVGDIFAWWRDVLRWTLQNILPNTFLKTKISKSALDRLIKESKDIIYKVLSKKAGGKKPAESGLVALDWMNGNRTVLVDPNLTGLITGLTIKSSPEEIFLSLIEATAFGARVIIERIKEYGINIREVITCGGLAEKNPLIMQVYADIIGAPIKISKSAQTCALGAALFGAVASGHFKDVESGQAKICGLKGKVYNPIQKNKQAYDELFKHYKLLHDAFGTTEHGNPFLSSMKGLLNLKRSVVSR